MRKLFGLAGALCLLLQVTFAQSQRYPIIPYPQELTAKPGTFVITPATSLVLPENPAPFLIETAQLELLLTQALGKPLLTADKVVKGAIVMRQNPALAGEEDYTLDISGTQLLMTAKTPTGFFRAIQTLRQLMPASIEDARTPDLKKIVLPAMQLKDHPVYGWRGMHLDVSRHFFSVDYLKKFIDLLALYKMNKLHLHLTDDQGWRIEIKKYPLLTSIGSRRSATQVENDDYSEKSTFRKEPYAGFYTQAQVRELVAYAADRHISIIPEIEMPGHATAAIASYAWLGAAHIPVPVSTTFGIHNEVLDISHPAVLDFMKDVLTELMPLFPSHVFHIGGDEVKFDQWVSSPVISSWMQSKGLNSGVDAQIWFANEIAAFLQAHHCRLMAWNEVMGAKFDHEAPAQAPTQHADSNIIVQFWKGDLSRIPAALQAGHELVNSWHPFTYFPRSIEKIYSFDPRADIQPQQQAAIIGLECAVWTEAITSEKAFNALVYPRLAAYGEVGWTALANKQYTHFQSALPFFQRHWAAAGITY